MFKNNHWNVHPIHKCRDAYCKITLTSKMNCEAQNCPIMLSFGLFYSGKRVLSFMHHFILVPSFPIISSITYMKNISSGSNLTPNKIVKNHNLKCFDPNCVWRHKSLSILWQSHKISKQSLKKWRFPGNFFSPGSEMTPSALLKVKDIGDGFEW